MLIKSESIVLMALLVFSFIAVATLYAEEGQKITGTVMSINAETGEMVVKDDAGEMKSLVGDPKAVDLKMLKEGDPVSVESDANGVIKSLEVSNITDSYRGQKITGTVMAINAETGEMVVKDDAGEMKSLVVDPKAGVDLKSLKEGDPVSVESDANGVIKSLEVSK